MSLREITKDLHTEAEKTEFAKLLLFGNISKEKYTDYLYQMIAVYGPVEFGCKIQGIFETLQGVQVQNWQVDNTGTVTSIATSSLADGGNIIASGDMAYWESAEFYPADRVDI